MKRLLIGLVILAALITTTSSDAAPGGCTDNPVLTPIPGAFEQITVSSTAIGFTTSKFQPDGGVPADMAIVFFETNAIRYRDDGVNPTATIGQPVAASTSITVCGFQTLKNIRFIRQSADATANVSYYRGGGQ